MTATTPTDGPITRRHSFVDALRGFALLGILVVNVEFIVQAAEVGWVDYDSASDRIVRFLVVLFGQMKVYPLFALLFGYGLSIQMANAARRGSDLTPRYRRRTIGLLVLGILHGVLFFPGDILVIYAIVGAIAYRFRNVETRRLLRLASVVYAGAAAVWFLVGGLDLFATSAAPSVPADALDTLSNGSFLDVAVLHFFYWIFTLGILALVQGPAVFAFFLAGVALGRTDWLSAPERHHEQAHRVLRWVPLGFVAATAGAALTIAGGRWETLGFAVGFVAAPLVAAAYVAWLGLSIGQGGRISRLLEASGRMSLTIYLLESVVVSTIAYGHGFGLFGDVGPSAGVALALMVWLGLSAFAFVWMRFARFGPFEWLLRSVTYGKRQPLRRA